MSEEFWDCKICLFARNLETLMDCGQCGFPKSSQQEPAGARWSCNVCLEEDNHFLSTHCRFCSADRNAPPLESFTTISLKDDASHSSPTAAAVVSDMPAEHNNVQQAVTTSQCAICEQEFSRTDGTTNHSSSFRSSCAVCVCYCPQCYANWIKSQISGGKAGNLKCPCLATTITYRQVSALSQYLQDNLLQVYEEAIRNKHSFVREQVVACPDCKYRDHVPITAKSFPCGNPQCGLYGIPICCKHLVHHKKYPRNERLCPHCVEEHGEDPALYAHLAQIIERCLDDRCPNPDCHQVVGLPEDITGNCMALVCSHCSMSFCGFCYAFANSWQNTHIHVRACARNPRKNYFVESVEIWQDIQRKRKREWVQTHLVAMTPPLPRETQDNIWKEVNKLLEE